MSEPIWLDVDEVIDMHAEQLAIFGGPEGVRDRGLLESAILRPVNQWHYGQTDMAALAAAYAFGDCLVNSLYAVYGNASEGFAERYLAMLAAGGTKHYSELLKPFGLDAKDPKFWDGGLSVIAGMIDELEGMG